MFDHLFKPQLVDCVSLFFKFDIDSTSVSVLEYVGVMQGAIVNTDISCEKE